MAISFKKARSKAANPSPDEEEATRELAREEWGISNLGEDEELIDYDTFASLHVARGSNLKWIQEQGGWTSAKTPLNCYEHFLLSESQGYVDALAVQKPELERGLPV